MWDENYHILKPQQKLQYKRMDKMKVYTCFPGGKAKALTMSYDDGKLQDKRLIGIFNKYGIKAT